MSVVKQILLFCDVVTTSCFANAFAEGDGCMDITISEARKSAKENGWMRKNGKDICPECLAHLDGHPRYIYTPSQPEIKEGE